MVVRHRAHTRDDSLSENVVSVEALDHMKARLPIFLLLALVSLGFSCRDRQGTVYSENPQSNTSRHSSERTDALSGILASASISQYEIERFTNEPGEEEFVDFKPIWDRLQIPRDQNGDFDGFNPSSTRWRTEIIDVIQPQLELNKTILKISAFGGADRRYLVFDRAVATSGEGQWRFSGNVDITDNYEASEESEYHRVVSNSKHVWLVLRTTPRIGTGISLRAEIWYKIDPDRPMQVLEYPLEGGRVMGNISDLEFKASVGDTKLIGNKVTQHVRYTVSFGAQDKPKFRWLFSKHPQVYFEWDEDANKFIVDNSRSDIPEEELDSTFGSAEEERFIKYNFRELLVLARGASAEQQKWFKRLIDKIPNGAQRTALIQAVNQ